MPAAPDAIADELFRHLFISVAEEMGVTLERTAYSPNMKERRDYSCALFDPAGELIAQAAHIPVHLGAFPLLMRRLSRHFRWRRGDVVLCNDPFWGGTHLPDITLVSPVFTRRGALAGFVANRAHHADVGGGFPGSMGPGNDLFGEGIIIPPVRLYERGVLNAALLDLLLRNVRTPAERRGDLDAQLAANSVGDRRMTELLERYGTQELRRRVRRARAASERAARESLAALPEGRYSFTDYLDDNGFGSGPLPISVTLTVGSGELAADFTGTAPQQPGPVNATLAVTHAAVLYALVCLLPPGTAINAGVFAPVRIEAPEGSLVHARPPAAVAAGNVETSQRLVDVVLGALAQAVPDRIPAASQGTMNNLTLGGISPETGAPWAYYETLGGGAGGGPAGPGLTGAHCHMSNTRNTPAEAMEYQYPVRVRLYAVRRGSGGRGWNPGGEGVIREIELLAPATATLLVERRERGPYGSSGGGPGAPGEDHVRIRGEWHRLRGKGTQALEAGARLRVATPGGGGWGEPPLPEEPRLFVRQIAYLPLPAGGQSRAVPLQLPLHRVADALLHVKVENLRQIPGRAELQLPIAYRKIEVGMTAAGVEHPVHEYRGVVRTHPQLHVVSAALTRTALFGVGAGTVPALVKRIVERAPVAV